MQMFLWLVHKLSWNTYFSTTILSKIIFEQWMCWTKYLSIFRTKSSLWILKSWCLLYLIFVCCILNYGCVLYFCFFTFFLPLQSIITCTLQLLEVIVFIIKTTLKHQNINKGKCFLNIKVLYTISINILDRCSIFIVNKLFVISFLMSMFSYQDSYLSFLHNFDRFDKSSYFISIVRRNNRHH